MPPHIGVRVRRFWRSQQAQPHDISLRRKPVLAIVQYRHTVAGLGQVSPFVAADFEFRHVPGGVIVSGAADDAVLGFVRGFGVADIDWELDFEKAFIFAPFDFGFHFYVAGVFAGGGGEGDGCLDPAFVADLSFGDD